MGDDRVAQQAGDARDGDVDHPCDAEEEEEEEEEEEKLKENNEKKK